MAPSFANIFMAELEKVLLDRGPEKPEEWWRFIDDCFLIWLSGEASFKKFLDFINSQHRTIKFTANWSTTSIEFLDVQVTVGSGRRLTTDLYVKPTDAHQYLMADSCHPKHTKRGIPYPQALRIRAD